MTEPSGAFLDLSRFRSGQVLMFGGLAFKGQLMLSAKKKWRKLDGRNRLPEIIEAIEFRGGIKHEIKAA